MRDGIVMPEDIHAIVGDALQQVARKSIVIARIPRLIHLHPDAIAVLGALRVITTDLGEAPDMAWPAAGFIGACLCLWSFDTFRVKALPVAKPLS